MSSDYGIKVSKPGVDISTTDIRDLILHSDYSMFKYNSTLSGDITINSGSQTGTLELTHGLGYVPAFLVYKDNSLFTPDTIAYADTNKIYITQDLGSPYGKVDQTWNLEQAAYGVPGALQVAVYAGNFLSNDYSSAFWLSHVYVPQGKSLTSATLKIGHIAVTTGGVKFRFYGIDEDNTNDISGGYPGGRPKTDAYVAIERAAVGQWAEQQGDMTAIVQEIINRGGWSSGNHMCFTMDNDGTGSNRIMYTENPPNMNDITLEIVYYDSGSLTSNFKVVVFKDKLHS